MVVALALPPVLYLVHVGGWPLCLLLMALAIVGVAEFRGLCERARWSGFWPAAFVAAPLLVLDAQLPGIALGRLAVAGALFGGLVWALFQGVEPARAVVGWSVTLAGSLYLGLPLGLALSLRYREAALGNTLSVGPLDLSRGTLWLVLALALTWACDAAAYLVGRSFGRRPFLHRISPRKTVEGAIAGVLAAAAAALVVGPAVGLTGLLALPLGIAGGIGALLGDLAESLLKRAGDVKDSGRLFPGHGGVLDRLDSLLFVIVVVYYGGELALALQGWVLGW